MKKKLIMTILTVIMLFAFAGVNACAYDKELANSITANYDVALSLAGRKSFYGNCNLATAYQLKAMGIYKNGLDESGTGRSVFDYFEDTSKTSGGYNVVTISGANCLYDLIEKYGNTIYNVVYCLGTGGTSGPNHVMYIRAIIDGNVYFADSFGCQYGRTYYPEGTCTVLSLEKFISSYRSMNGDPFGCVYFTNEDSKHYTGSAINPDGWISEDRNYVAGNYIITASMLRIRDEANTDAESVGLIPNGTTVKVTEISDNWGKTEYDGETGWICLDYALRLSSVADTSENEKEEQTQTDTQSLKALMLNPDKSAVFINTDVTWTAKAEGGESSKYFYAFYIYRDGEKIYNGTFSTANTITYNIDKKGTYQACVTIMDSANNKAQMFSDEVECVGSEDDVLLGDADNNGVISAADSRFALRVAAHIDTLTGKNFICADIDKDGVITSADARLILRKASGTDK